MNRARPLAAFAAFALALACRTSPVDRDRLLYAPHEEGLTLAYENPSLPDGERMNSRLQVRVDSAQPAAGGESIVGALRHTRLQGEERYTFLIKDGGLVVADEQKRAALLLPEGFPDRISAWGVPGGDRSRVLGRATAAQFDRLLPQGAPRVGVWIESMPEKGGGPRTRTFLLPDVGIAEVLEWRGDRWTPTLKLVGRSFTDAKPKPATPPATKPAPGRGAKKK